MQNTDASVPQVRGRVPWEQGEAGRCETAAPTQTRLVHPQQTPIREPHPRAGHVQSGDRQQASGPLVRLRVDDIAPHGQAATRAMIRQKKTGMPMKFELTELTREAVEAYIKAFDRKPGEYLFRGCRGRDHMGARTYARYVVRWISGIGLNPHFSGTHSLRWTKAQENREHRPISRHRGRPRSRYCRTHRRVTYIRGKACLARFSDPMHVFRPSRTGWQLASH
jgi:hypothetical protein